MHLHHPQTPSLWTRAGLYLKKILETKQNLVTFAKKNLHLLICNSAKYLCNRKSKYTNKQNNQRHLATPHIKHRYCCVPALCKTLTQKCLPLYLKASWLTDVVDLCWIWIDMDVELSKSKDIYLWANLRDFEWNCEFG